MKRKILVAALMLVGITTFAEERKDSVTLDEVTVTALYRNNVNTGSLITTKQLREVNHGQGPDYVLSTLPNIYAYNDNGTRMGYSYFRIRGMGQERMNVTIDGMPWNEAEDFGCYFSNSPDLMSSMHSIKVEKGASVTNNGTAAYAGNVTLESVNLKTDTTSYVDLGAGSFSTFRTTAVYNMGIKKGWGLHVRATQQQTDGFREHAYNNSQALTVKVGYFFNDKHSIDFLTMNGYHRNGQGYAGVIEELLPDHPTPFKQQLNGCLQQETDNFFLTTNRLLYKGVLSEKVALTASLYWNHLKGDYRIGWADETKESGIALNNYDLIQHLYGFNTIAKWNVLDNLSITGGVNAYMFQRQHKGYDIPGDTIINHWRSKNFQSYYNNTGYKPDINVFSKVKWTPIRDLKLEGNIQYRYTSLHYRVKQSGSFEDYDRDFDWNFINYGIGASYSVSRNSEIYTRFNVTNREPSRTDMFGSEFVTEDGLLIPKDNERVYDIEAGYEIRSEKVNLNINGFYMNFSNELVATGKLSPYNCLPLHEQHDAYRFGLELATTFKPIRNMEVILNGALSKNKVKDFNGGETNHTFSPSQTLFSEINYTIGKTKFGLNANYRSKVYLDLENEHKLRENFVLGAYIDSRISERFSLSLNLTNITNRLNLSNGSVSDGIGYYIIDSPFMFFVSGKIYM